VVTHGQLTALGLSAKAIERRIQAGRLHPIHRSVYAVGRPELTQLGRWMAAVMSCGPNAMLSHGDAGAAWGFVALSGSVVEISVAGPYERRRPGIRMHRRPGLDPGEVTLHHGIPITSPVRTLLDLATRLGPAALERAVNEADRLDVVDPDSLRAAVERRNGQRGAPALRRILDRATFRLTDSELERRLLRLAARAGLQPPLTGALVNGYKVDFFWPALGLVVETDGLRYHRTPAQQARDRARDQAHAAAGLTPLRFTHAQVRYEPRRVEATLAAVARRLAEGRLTSAP
jgi:very-short-patch-repair endonuclease